MKVEKVKKAQEFEVENIKSEQFRSSENNIFNSEQDIDFNAVVEHTRPTLTIMGKENGEKICLMLGDEYQLVS